LRPERASNSRYAADSRQRARAPLHAGRNWSHQPIKSHWPIRSHQPVKSHPRQESRRRIRSRQRVESH
jgi:hypothetical protein